ncbi:MAG: ABC transporter permease [Deltaproteobacteria bacterium]
MRRTSGRALGALGAAVGATLLVSLFLDLVPGDPVEVLLGEQSQAVDRDALRRAMWLDRPLPVQAFRFLEGFVSGELRSSVPPFEERIWPRLREMAPRTGLLALVAMLFAVAFSVPLGVASAVRAGQALDRALAGFAILGVSAPSFLIGQLLIWLFGIRLRWLPVSGDDRPLSLLLPSLTLGLGLAALLSRVTRAAVLEVLSEEYVLAARARGLSEAAVVWNHAFRNALLPVLTIVGLQMGALLTGSIVVEKVFAWPGLGTLLLTSIERRDYNAVRACVLVFTLTYLAINLATDACYRLADPRTRNDSR